VLVLAHPVLDALEGFKQLFGQLAHLAVVEHHFPALVGQGLDGAHPGRGAGGEHFTSVGNDLLHGDPPLLHFHPQVARQLDDAQASDPRKDRVLQRRGDQGPVLQQEEQVAGRALLDVAVLDGVQEHALHVTLGLGLLLGQRADHVVGGGLDPARAAQSSPDARGGDGFGVARAEVGADVGGDDHHPGRGAQVHADSALRVGEGPDVDGVPGHEVLLLPSRVILRGETEREVALDHLPHGAHECLRGEGRHLEALHGVGHAPGIAIGAEDLQSPGLLGEGLQPLEAAQAVLGGVVDQGQLGKGVALRQQRRALLLRQLCLRSGREVLLLDVGFRPGAVSGALGDIHPGIDFQRKTFGHAGILSRVRRRVKGSRGGKPRRAKKNAAG
jgi:hypothetical protein